MRYNLSWCRRPRITLSGMFSIVNPVQSLTKYRTYILSTIEYFQKKNSSCFFPPSSLSNFHDGSFVREDYCSPNLNPPIFTFTTSNLSGVMQRGFPQASQVGTLLRLAASTRGLHFVFALITNNVRWMFLLVSSAHVMGCQSFMLRNLIDT